MSYLLIFVGGGLGSIARFACSGVVANWFGQTFPWGTLVVNVSGSFVIGFVSTLTGTEGRWLAPPEAREFILIGICGGYTTFSSFSLQTLGLARDGEWLRAFANITGSVVLCLISVWLGHLLAATLNGAKGH